MTKIIVVRVPFRIPLGGGSTDLPSYYKEHGGFIFAASINLYMDVLIKEPRSDDSIHVHYKHFEVVDKVSDVQHELAREALCMHEIDKKIAISFKADTPAGTGLGSSGACAVALHKGISLFKGEEVDNIEAAKLSFDLTRKLNLPDGVQDPYACSTGGFCVLDIDTTGRVDIRKPNITDETKKKFFENTLFYYTGVVRASKDILVAQDAQKVLDTKHKTKEIGKKVLQAFELGDLDTFGRLMHEHWNNKKKMSGKMSSNTFDEIYNDALEAGALGGKIMGAGGGGYFMIYSPNLETKEKVREKLVKYNMREMDFDLDEKGARTHILEL